MRRESDLVTRALAIRQVRFLSGQCWSSDPGFEVRARGPLDQNRHKVAYRPAIERLVVSVHDLLESVGRHLGELLAQSLHYPRQRLGFAA